MAHSFDPYYQWLDFEPGQTPADYYQLLGIDPQENDPAVISLAADRLTAKIRGNRPGEYLRQWQDLLDQLKAAKKCLLDAQARAAYDAAPRTQPQGDSTRWRKGPPPLLFGDTDQLAPTGYPRTPLGQPAPQETAAAYLQQPQSGYPQETAGFPPRTPLSQTPVSNVPIPMGGPVPEEGVSLPRGTAVVGPVAGPMNATPGESAAGSGKWPVEAQKLVRVLVVVVVLLGGALAYFLTRQDEQPVAQQGDETPAAEPAPDAPPVAPAPPETPSPAPTPDPDEPPDPVQRPVPAEPPDPVQRPVPVEPPAPVPQPGPIEQPSRPAGDPRKRAALKRALADARQTMKDRDLIAAKTFLDRAAAVAQSPEDKAELAQVETYHANLTEFWRGIAQAMGSFNGGEVITLRGRPIAIVESAPGKLIFRDRGQNYTYQPHRLTGDWIELLVNRSFAKGPTSMVLYGTFLALDGDGDPQRAGQLWRQAGRAGAEIGVLIGQPEEGPGAAPSHSAPPADAAELKRAEQILRQSHSTAFDQATSVAGKVRLADKMLAVAAESATDPNQRFVALTTARDTAISAGEPELVFLAIERLDASYSIDAQAMRLTALEAMGRNVHGTRTSNELAERNLTMASQLVEAKQLDRAARLALTALAAARKSGNLLLMRKATLAVDEIKSAREKR